MKTIAIVIVNWNGAKDTIACLTSIAAMKKNDADLTVIVVDNGSKDDSVKRIGKAHPWVTILSLDENRGFAGGNNVGITYAMHHGSEYIWLLNNDTVVDADALSVVDAFADSTVGIAGSKIYFAPGREYHKDRYKQSERGRVIWYAGGIIDWSTMLASHLGVDEVDHGQYDRSGETPFVTGCSLMMRRSVVDAIGLLDERLYLYLEDLDFCLRAKRAGYRLVYYPASLLWHVNAGSSGGPGNALHDYYITRNRLWIGMKYAPVRTKIALLREAVSFLRGSNADKRQAVSDFFLWRWGRRYAQKKP